MGIMEVVPSTPCEIGIGANIYRHICKWEELRIRCIFNVVLCSRYSYTVFICLPPICSMSVICSGSNTSNHPPYRIIYLSDNRNASPLITS